jgi:hypothetical protein
MNFKEIEDLLEKYYNGETTLVEERRLKEFFLREPVPVHLEPEAELFRTLHAASDQNIDDADFDRKFMERIETPVIPIYSSRKKFYFSLSLAAAIILLIGLLFTFRDAMHKRSFNNTITDPQLAYSETRKALMLVSINFNEGLDQVQHLSGFKRGMDEMQKLSTFYKYQPLIINPGDSDRQKNK